MIIRFVIVKFSLCIPTRSFAPTERVTIDAVRVNPHHWLTEPNLIERGDRVANIELSSISLI